MTDRVTRLIDRLATVERDDLPDLFKDLIRDRALSRVMRRINADLAGADAVLRARAAQALGRLGFPD